MRNFTLCIQSYASITAGELCTFGNLWLPWNECHTNIPNSYMMKNVYIDGSFISWRNWLCKMNWKSKGMKQELVHLEENMGNAFYVGSVHCPIKCSRCLVYYWSYISNWQFLFYKYTRKWFNWLYFINLPIVLAWLFSWYFDSNYLIHLGVIVSDDIQQQQLQLYGKFTWTSTGGYEINVLIVKSPQK